jgi:hypothetical protein
VVSDGPGTATLIERQFPQCSSIGEANADLIAAFGLERYYAEVARHESPTITLGRIAEAHGVQTFDFIKTDLEGMDFRVIASLGEPLRQTLVLQMELRFQPMYAGEADFPTAAAHLQQYGFRVLDMVVEKWRYRTPHALMPTKGQIAYADVLFVNDDATDSCSEGILKQALLLGLQGYVNYSEYILGRHSWSNARERQAAAELAAFFFSAMGPGDLQVPLSDFPHVVERH